MRLVLSSSSVRRGRSTRSTLSKNAATILITEGDDTSSIAAPLLDLLVLEKPPSPSPPSPLCSPNNEKKKKKKKKHEENNSRSRSRSCSTRSRSLSIRHSRSKPAQTKTNSKKNKLKSTHSANGNHDAASPRRRPCRSSSVPAQIGGNRYEIDKAVARSYIERLEKQLEERDEAIVTLLKKNEKMKGAKEKMQKQLSDKQVSKEKKDYDHKTKKKSSRHNKIEETSSSAATSAHNSKLPKKESSRNKKLNVVNPVAGQESRKQVVDKESSSRNIASKHRSEGNNKADNTKRNSDSKKTKKKSKSKRNKSVDIDSFMTAESTIHDEGDCDDYMMESSAMGDIDYYTDDICGESRSTTPPRSNRTRKSSKSTKDLKSVYVPKKKVRSSSSRDIESKKSQKEQHKRGKQKSPQRRTLPDTDVVDVDYHMDLRKKQEYNNKVKSKKWETKQNNNERGSDPDLYLDTTTTNKVKPKKKEAKKKLSYIKKRGSGCDPDLYLDTCTTPGDVDFHTEEDRFTESVARTSLNCSF